MEKDFKRSRIYKKISCEYPSINFVAKKKRAFKSNYQFTPNKDINMFNAMNFKPCSSLEDDENSEGSNTKRKKKAISKKRSPRKNNGKSNNNKNYKEKKIKVINQSSEGRLDSGDRSDS